MHSGIRSALHKCPHCKKGFEYSPEDYHRKVTCGNAKCTKEFGFYEFNVSDRALKDVKITVKKEHEHKAKM